MQFNELGLPEAILRAAAEAGYTSATPIQSRAIPILLAGHDLVGCSQTGSGKTAAFAMPLLAKIDPSIKAPQVLVLTPTRELATQVAASFEEYGAGLKKLGVLAVYGGAAYQPQLAALRRGVQVIVGTPGRVIDHIKQGALRLDSIRHLVLDEADEMLRMGFIDDVKWILDQAPDERQVALFSATMPPPIREIAEQHLREPQSITLKKLQQAGDTIRQQYLVVLPRNKPEVLSRVLETETTDGVIVFVKTKAATVEVAERLVARGFNAAPLNGDIPQTQRQRTVDKLKAGEIDVLVATDVAARGLDVDRISHVINYDLPHDREAYVHRIGRTGRAGRQGQAILLVTPSQRGVIRSIQKTTGQEIELIESPTVETINSVRAAKFKEQITAALQSRQVETLSSLVGDYCGETGEPVERVAAALAVMAIGDRRFFARPIEEPAAAQRRDEGGRRHDNGPIDRKRKPKPEFSRDRKGRAADSTSRERFRIEVGRAHGVQPGNLVGAIAGETGLEGAQIGKINIYDRFSLVDLPAGMPESVFDALGRTWVAGRRLRITRDRAPRPRKFGKKPAAARSS